MKEEELKYKNTYNKNWNNKDFVRSMWDDGIKEGRTQTLKEELEFLNKQIDGIKVEMKIAKKYIDEHEKCDNAQQSILIYNMWLLQLNKRKKELISKLEDDEVEK